MWGGGCVTMLCMTIALPKFFDYQEGLSGSTLADGGGGSGGFHRFVGGDDYGRLIIDIPDLSDPRWRPDPIYDRRILPPKKTSPDCYRLKVHFQHYEYTAYNESLFSKWLCHAF